MSSTSSSPKTTAFFTCSNGLGDKCLDIIGVNVLCDYLGYCPIIKFNKDFEEHFEWGTNQYDTRLFDGLSNPSLPSEYDYMIKAPNASSSLCPYKTYEFLYDLGVPVCFFDINQKYREVAKILIRPSPIIEARLPQVLENAYGIHLRKTDKIKSHGCDIRHENKFDEFAIIIEKLLENVKKIIKTETEPTFLIVSEDEIWKNTIQEMILEEGEKDESEQKTIKIINLDDSPLPYTNYKSVLDMFALSRCKNILQGVKYSSYSILAALIGNGKLVNYSPALESNTECLIYAWNSVVEINGEYMNQPGFIDYSKIQNLSIIPRPY